MSEMNANIDSTSKVAEKIQWLPKGKIEWLFAIMAFCAIVPLYFEDTRQLLGLIFVSLMGYLAFSKAKPAEYSISKYEKTWLAVAISYAVIFILSFLLRPPYTDDGSWRIAAPVFILLLSAWYFLAIRYQQQKNMLLPIGLISISMAIFLFIAELFVEDRHPAYQLGIMLSDYGAVGFIVPITTLLLGIYWLQNRSSKLLLLLFVLGVVLTGLSASRTSFSLLLIPALILIGYLFFGTKNLNKSFKAVTVFIIVIAIGVVATLSKNKIVGTFEDFTKASSGDYYSSLGMRYVQFNIGLNLVMDNPVMGVGVNEYKSSLIEELEKNDYSDKVKQSVASFMQIHNQYLMDYLLSGIFGFIAVLLFMGYPLYCFYKKYSQSKQLMPLMAFAAILGLMFIQFFGANFTYTYTTIFYMLAVSSLLSFVMQDSGEKSD